MIDNNQDPHTRTRKTSINMHQYRKPSIFGLPTYVVITLLQCETISLQWLRAI